MTELTSGQIDFGQDRLKSVAIIWGVPEKKAAEILLDIDRIRDFWQWINAEQFLSKVVHNNG